MADAMDTNEQTHLKSNKIKEIPYYSFFDHPNKNCMTYLEHSKLSLTLSSKLFLGSVKAFIHAFIPAIFETSTTVLVKEIQDIINNSGCESSKEV
jgi:hypothetical protein